MKLVFALGGFVAGLLVMWSLQSGPAQSEIPAGYYDLSSVPSEFAEQFNDPAYVTSYIKMEQQKREFMDAMGAQDVVALPETVPSYPFGLLFAPPENAHWPDLIDEAAQVILDQSKNEWVILNIWATWCAPCVKELPDMQRAAPLLAESGVRLIAVNADLMRKDTLADVTTLFAERDITTLPSIVTAGGDIDVVLKSTGLERVGFPTNLVFAPGGKPFAYFVGLPDQEEVWSSPDMLEFFKALAESDAS